MFCMRAFWLHTEQKNLEKVQLNECIIVLKFWEFALNDCFRKHLKNLNYFRTIKILPGTIKTCFLGHLTTRLTLEKGHLSVRFGSIRPFSNEY